MPGERFSAQHGAFVVHQVEDQGFLAEVIAEFHGAAGIVDEADVGRHLAVEMLFDADVLEIGGANARGRRHDAFRHGLAPCDRSKHHERHQNSVVTQSVGPN